MAQKSFIFKIVVVGDGGVGKTSLVLRYCENSFKENYIMTIGSNFSAKSVELPDYPQLAIKLQIWDLAGQKHFSFVRPPFYRGASGIVWTFDLTRRGSFQNLDNWKQEAEKVIGKRPSVLVGNKLDIADEGLREISVVEAEAYKEELGASAYYETSAKEGISVEGVFRDLTLAILKSSGRI
ncbi:MAG: Rab family GTPase [Promethearchaeota archaeon]